MQAGASPRAEIGCEARSNAIQGFSGGSEREFDFGLRFRPAAVRTSGTTGLGTGAKGFVNDGLDGARTTATFGAAAEAAVDLLGVTRQVFRGADSAADIMVAEDVAGTNNH